MKSPLFAFGAIALSATLALSADVITTTTSSTGTINEFGPDRIIIQGEESPFDYGVTRETTFVDEAGVPVRVERITRGLPVTVQTVREGDRIRASRVIVHRTEAPMNKARAKALREMWEDRAKHAATPEERAQAKAMRKYYDELEDHLED